MNLEPIILTGTRAQLIPQSLDHLDALYHVAAYPEIWPYMILQTTPTRERLAQYIASGLADQTVGTCLSFTIVDQQTGALIGSTRLFDIAVSHRRGEIGHTWLTPSVWRTRINTECKYLLLRYAFETLDMIRVQLKTDSRNIRSQAAIERLGAVKEGILRNHVILPDGYIRHSVMYSITDTEWPEVRKRLETFLSS
ncbi:MAG: GNAT family N-acetyltransferase [Anaerolineales bacterium]|nr:GNAT family N-acetyltransferase [Anaerolineales bacterium]